jgi:uncharacterized protein YigA (DUF484 family)
MTLSHLFSFPSHRVTAAPSQVGPASYKRSTEEKLTEANWRLAKANEDLQAKVKQLQADLLASERRFKGCYAEVRVSSHATIEICLFAPNTLSSCLLTCPTFRMTA